MIIVDATIVNVAIPSIIKEIGLTATQSEWLNSIYSLVFAALLITAGRAGDRWGRRRLFALGTVIFVAASLVAATSPNGGVLILGRFLQGLGGALILPATLSTVNALFIGKERAIAFAVWGSTIGGMAAVGPLLGGWLTTDFSWRWAFLINLPIGLLVLTGILLFIPETSDPNYERGGDLGGVALTVIGLSAIVFSLIEGVNYGWWRQTSRFELGPLAWPRSSISIIPLLMAFGVVCLVAFILYEGRRRRAHQPVLVELSLFRIKSFAAGNVAVSVVSLGEFGLLFVLPLFLQSVLGYSALGTGAILLALASGTFVAGGMTPQLAQRVGARGVARLGLGLEVLGVLLLALMLSPTASLWALVPWLFTYGLGVGMATAQLTGVILTEVPVAVSGQASGIQSTSRQVGSAIGVAILGMIYVTDIGSRTLATVSAIPGVSGEEAARTATAIRASGGTALSGLRHVPHGDAIVTAASRAITSSAQLVFAVAGCFILVGLVATFLLPRIRDAQNDVEGR
ncbi:MAG: MFS transporter [Acidobacteria bacterium]|nr:MFS transporter [Acidobacteriota bacterium]